MDTFDSHRSTVPARLPGHRPGAMALRATAGTPAANSPSPLSIQVVLRGTRRYWLLVLMLWLVGSAAVSAAVYLNVKPIYKASGLLRVDPNVNDLYGVRPAGEHLDPFLATQVQLITSPNVLTAAGAKPEVSSLRRIQAAGDVVQELRKVVGVGVIPGTYLIEVSMHSDNNAEAATVVNAVVAAFLSANDEWSDGMTKKQIKILEGYERELKNQSDEIETRWKALVARGDTANLLIREANNREGQAATSTSKGEQGTARTSVTVEEYMAVKRELFNVGMELAEAEAWLAAAKASAEMARNNTSEIIDEDVIKRQVTRRFRVDPDVVNLIAKMKEEQDRLDEHRRILHEPGDAAEARTLKRLASLNAQYQRLWDSKSLIFRDEVIEQSVNGKVDPQAEIREAKTKVEKLRSKKLALAQQTDDLHVKSQREATDQIEIHLLLDERDTLKSMQEAVLRKLEQLRFEAKGDARIREVNKAMIPGKPVSDKRLTYMAMTPVGILGTVLCLVVLLEVRAGRVADPEVLSHRMKHEVFSIAPLPDLRAGDDANSEKTEQRLARFVQSLDHLRVALCEGGIPGEGRCVMITSATGGEGKTTLSAHLAARCANSGTSTLLIDADLRRASLGRLLDVAIGQGLGDVLEGEADLDEALITVQAGGFHFLSAGTPGRDPSRVLKSARLSELINRLRRTYDLVIIDTPPVLPVADALIMGRWADGAVMAARFDASRLPLVERANRQLALAGIPVLGVVVNGVRGQDASYGSYAYNYNYFPARDDRSAEAPAG